MTSRSAFQRPEGIAVDARGNVYVSSSSAHTIAKVTSEGVLTTLAGSPGEPGSADGTGDAARFFHPGALAVDSAGNLFVADSGNHTIRKVSPAGAVTTLAGMPGRAGSADGTGRAMRFSSPGALAVDEAGNVYVGDSASFTLRKVTATGIGTTVAGRAGSSGISDGTRSGARFLGIMGMARDPAGDVYLVEADKIEGVAVRRVTPKGQVTTLSRSRGAEGAGVVPTGFVASFQVPHGIAVDGGGNLYISDYANVIWKVTSTGVATQLAGSPMRSGHEDGRGDTARFNVPQGLAVDSAGKVYVADSGNDRVRIVSPDGAVTTLTVKPGEP